MSTTEAAVIEQESRLIMNTYARYPIVIDRAKDARLYDLDGKEYVDLLAGIAVVNVGHCREEIAQAIADQARAMVHVSNLFYQKKQVELAERLLETCQADKVFFCNSGAEANEAAIKLARRYMRDVKGRDAYEIISLENSFHGRTMGTLAATGQCGLRRGFEPLPGGFKNVPANDICAMREAVDEHTAAVIIEMVQGEGGVLPLDAAYVNDLMALLKDRDVLLIVDEIQTGLGRTGAFWAHEHFNLKPDIFTCAKALAGGLPMGAMLATEEVARGFTPGAHATTFGGGPVLCAAALKVLDIIRDENLVERSRKLGESTLAMLKELILIHPGKIRHVRGMGLMIGVELSFPGQEVHRALLDKGFVCNLAQGRILRLVPPLIIEQADIEAFVAALNEVLAAVED
ncbi:MAG: acetylornithine/N-succinyldiaminopimelate aminotransferase [Desulfovibrionales bacterium]|jgi:acetylornithine aminotransferase|nr:acetylornithine/N-succinyldiaminopimelate aminotransferase [Desulfovibrionales bacterium]